jgi:uncharacterized membrane protein YqjE
LAFIPAAILIPESSDPESGRFDWAGFILGPIALGTIVFAIILGETSGYTSGRVLTLFAVGVVAGAVFGFVETRTEKPMLDVRYFRKAAFSGSLFVAFATYFGVFSIFFLTALYLQVVVGYSAYRIAALFVPMAISMILASAIAGRWVAKVGPRLPVAVGCLAAGGGVLLTDFSMLHSVVFIELAVYLVLAGVGFGIAVVPITSVALSIVPAKHSGMAASATTTSREVGTVLGVAALGSLFSRQLISYLTSELIRLGVPKEFRQIVIDAVLGGQTSGSSAQQATNQFGGIVAKVIQAAYDAVHSGVTISLMVAGGVILVSGVVAWATFSKQSAGLD